MTVPDHRLDEMMQNFRRLEQDNQRLRGTVDALMARQPVQPTPEPEGPFQPEVERALQARFEREMAKRFAPIEQQTKQAIGALADQNDHLKFSLRYGADVYEKFQDKIERVREERSRAGQWVSREDAYRLVYFDENGKKPAVNPATVPQAAPQAPALDPYTGLIRGLQCPKLRQRSGCTVSASSTTTGGSARANAIASSPAAISSSTGCVCNTKPNPGPVQAGCVYGISRA